MVDRSACTGCGSCVEACPHGAVVLHQGKAAKCDLCQDRLAAGLKPRCVDTCSSRARLFEELGGALETGRGRRTPERGGALVSYADNGG